MRLLHTASDGRFSWTKNYIVEEDIPAYAILSHTWGGQEVTFNDLNNFDNATESEKQSSEGYQKLRFCAQQAKQDGLDYFWVDTCCIDKSDSSELQESINSMFRWYQRAVKCYVYLADVEQDTLHGDGNSAFKQSRWFTRGWTLQELLAPKSVEFFSREGKRLGDKESLGLIIQKITEIPVDALRGNQLSEYTVSERFSWAENRQTTRQEDAAYCLLGIFGIYMPLIYGEGKDNAIKRLRKEVHEASKDIAAANNTKSRSQSQEERLGKIYSWLSPPDPYTNYHKAQKQRHAETGTWLVEGDQFIRWKSSPVSRLWLYGIPGCGKTILSSTIVENLLQHCGDNTSMATAYFYFDFKDTQKQNPELMLRSLLWQLLQRAVTIPKDIDSLFASQNGRLPSLHALTEVLQPTLQEFAQVYIVLDALDECTQRAELMDILKTVAGWQLDNVHLLMTSRKERDIESSLDSFVMEEDTICLQMDVVDKDIERYVQQRLSVDKDLEKWNKDAALRQEIETALMRGARGMFRWTVCQLDRLAKCRNRAMLRKSLASLPQTLDQTYDHILSAISEEDSPYAKRILQWLTFSARPLSVEEIAEVIAIDVARDPAFDRDEVLEDPLEVLNICSSLVTVTVVEDWPGLTQQIVALAHYSVQEYLVSNRITQGSAKQYSMQGAECQKALTKSCLKYLTHLQQPLSEEIVEASALARYAAQYWSSHLQKAEDEIGEMSWLAMDLLSMEKPAYLTWIQLCDPDWRWDAPKLGRGMESVAASLYYWASLGLTAMMQISLDQGADVNAQGGEYGNALQVASFGGHEQVVKLLLDNKTIDINAQGGFYGTALQAASVEGHEQIVKMLLDNKTIDVNLQGGERGNALQAAASRGHERVVEMLLLNNADVNAQGGYYGTALQAASAGGYEQIVKMLIENVDVNAQGGQYGSALQAASAFGYEQIVKILLAKNADVNAQGGHFASALQAASAHGHGQIVKILLAKNADVNAQGGRHNNALQAASAGGHTQVVKMLLDSNAEVNAQCGWTVKQLLDSRPAGEYHSSLGYENYGNALQAASAGGYVQIVKILLDHKAEVNTQCGWFHTAIQAAAAGGHTQVVRMLLDNGADGNLFGGRHGTAMQAARQERHEQVVEMLLAASTDHQHHQEKAAVKKAVRAPHSSDSTPTITTIPVKSSRFPRALSRLLPVSRANKAERTSGL